ncbi:uncharacterized protein [Montipora capricornis]|uniref:uncharacterized protein n=1 Tax=Montipora foliosa TaxID=591990 RepID=UPI0035F20368
MAGPRGYFTTGSLLAFIFLGIIRGSFSVAIYFALLSYHSPSLVFLLRTPGSLALYILFMVFRSSRDSDLKQTFSKNLTTWGNYGKFAVMGLIQLAAPYLFFMYGLKVINPTTAGVYMAAAPWISVLLERLPFVRSSHPVPVEKIVAMAVGVVGIVLVSVSGIAVAASSKCTGTLNEKMAVDNRSNTSMNTSSQEFPCFTNKDLALSLLSLIGGSLMWSMSSVYWRAKRGDIHYVSSGIANNIFGGIFALILWLVMWRFNKLQEVQWSDGSAVFSVIFLTVMSGWVAALLLDYLYAEVGLLVTNRVLCLVPFVAWFEDWMFVRKFKVLSFYWYIPVEVVGVVLMFVGLTIYNLEPESLVTALHRPLLNSEEHEVAYTDPFHSNIWNTDEGMTSDEEIRDTSYLRACSTNSTVNSFPPLIEVPRQDAQ